jgi:hypothetical protein
MNLEFLYSVVNREDGQGPTAAGLTSAPVPSGRCRGATTRVLARWIHIREDFGREAVGLAEEI